MPILPPSETMRLPASTVSPRYRARHAFAERDTWRIRVEETALRERFGAEFDAHRKRTWAIIPLVW